VREVKDSKEAEERERLQKIYDKNKCDDDFEKLAIQAMLGMR
jgi:hypothetical protein